MNGVTGRMERLSQMKTTLSILYSIWSVPGMVGNTDWNQTQNINIKNSGSSMNQRE
jgi:hypothetical protein